MTQQEVWELVLRYEGTLRQEIRRFLPRHRRDEIDEMYSDVVVARCHQIMARYDPVRFPVKPITHLVANCRWYAYKWASGRHYKGGRHGPSVSLQEQHVGSYVGPHEVQARVGMILESLPEDAARLLEWSLMKGYTVGEIAEHLGCTTREARAACDEALALARSELTNGHASPGERGVPVAPGPGGPVDAGRGEAHQGVGGVPGQVGPGAEARGDHARSLWAGLQARRADCVAAPPLRRHREGSHVS